MKKMVMPKPQKKAVKERKFLWQKNLKKQWIGFLVLKRS